jgi:hypothetical protein
MSQERLHDLLADRALVGLSPQEEMELVQLLAHFPGTDIDALERAAAATLLASLERLEQIPDHVVAKLYQQAGAPAPVASRPMMQATVPMPGAPSHPIPERLSHAPSNVVPFPAPPAPPPAQPVKKPSRVFAITGWVAAAACLLLLLGALLVKRPVPQPVASVERSKLLTKPGTTKLDWSATADPASTRAKGDVVWNAVEQRGFMRFQGLAKNDKNAFQYQLWIFDKNRDDKYPVDGGVFDVDSETGEVVVPITARLKVDEPVLFAVTVEKPGGVVVSKRERIVVTAKPSAG